jgi:hypothetical protein
VLKKEFHGLLLIAIFVMAAPAFAYQNGMPGWQPYLPPPANFYSGHPGWMGYPASPRFFYPQRSYANNWYRPFNFQRPWGKVNGAMAPDGSFWININFGGNVRDLQYLMTLMQLSTTMQMGAEQAPVLQENFSNGRNTLWPL